MKAIIIIIKGSRLLKNLVTQKSVLTSVERKPDVRRLAVLSLASVCMPFHDFLAFSLISVTYFP